MSTVNTLLFCVFLALAGLSQQAHALPLHDGDKGQLDLSFDLGMAAYRSDRSYAQTSVEQGNKTWSEAYADISLTGSLIVAEESSWYASLGALTTATRGDGDAAGFTTGDEERIALEDASVGWRSGNLFPSLGKDGVDISVGRQNFMLGSGFLIEC